jgi:hypothetical protein
MKTLALILFASLLNAAAQYEIIWSTMDSGGGQSSGGAYTLTGTIGQPDAGVSTARGYTLYGGFWNFVELEIVPALRIIHAGPNVILAWPDPSLNFELQSTVDLLPAAWSNVADAPLVVGAEKQVTLPLQPTRQFFRLRRP